MREKKIMNKIISYKDNKIRLATSTKKILKRLISISALLIFVTPELISQEKSSILLSKEILFINATGVAFLGSGITENDAKTLAINDAKRTALEQAGTYLETHTEVLNYRLVKDEIITYSASVLKVNILKIERQLVNDMFTLKVAIEATVDIGLLHQRIEEIRKDYSLLKQLEAERERNRKLEERIDELKASGSTASKQKVKSVINQLNSIDWFNKAYNSNDNNLTIAYYTKAISIDSQFTYAYINRGNAYIELDKIELGIKDLTKAISLDPQISYGYINRGRAYIELDKIELGIKDLTKAISLDPQISYAYSNRGAAYRLLGRYEKAIDDCNIAISLDPQNSSAYSNRAYSYEGLGRYKTAIMDHNKYLELNPSDHIAYCNRGVAYFSLGQFYNAINDFTKSIEIDPTYPNAYLGRGLTYQMLGDNKAAAKSGANDYKAAIMNYNKFIELNPNDNAVIKLYSARGLTYCQLGQFEKAINDFTKYIEIDPTYPDAYKNRGFAYQMLGDNKAAAKDLNEYLRINGNKSGDATEIRGLIRDLGYTPSY